MLRAGYVRVNVPPKAPQSAGEQVYFLSPVAFISRSAKAFFMSFTLLR
jgi:hypothetical protein